MLSALLRFAKKAGLVERNVVRDLDRDDRPGTQRLSEPRYLSSAELARLLAELGDVFRPVILICSLAGLRISEALGLHWGDVRFGAKTIGVWRQLDYDGTVREDTKTSASTATVPLLPALERELREHRPPGGVDLRRARSSSASSSWCRAETAGTARSPGQPEPDLPGHEQGRPRVTLGPRPRHLTGGSVPAL